MKALFILAIVLMTITACTPKEQGAVLGDTVKVDYVGKFFNGTVFDTSMESVGLVNGLQRQQYEPLTITIGKRQVIAGFENALIGMNVDDTRSVSIPPAEAYGVVNSERVIWISRQSTIDRNRILTRNVDITLEQLAQIGNPAEGDTVDVEDISYTVLEVTETGASIRVDVDEGDMVTLPGTLWNSTVIAVQEDNYVVRQDPFDGSILTTAFGPARIEVSDTELTSTLLLEVGGTLVTQDGAGKVLEVNETHAMIDFNHPLAGQTLVFDITRVE